MLSERGARRLSCPALEFCIGAVQQMLADPAFSPLWSIVSSLAVTAVFLAIAGHELDRADY
jgi:hypothetical protein